MHKGALVSAAAAVMLLSAPCNAAQDFRASLDATSRPAAYAGGVVRLTLGEKKQLRPVARLRMGMTPSGGGPEAAARLATDQNRGIELGLHGMRRPEIYVGGQSISESADRLNLNGSTRNTVAIMFGVALVVVTVLVVTSLDGLGDSFPDFNDTD